MPVAIVILIILGAGIFAGRRFESAREAHQVFRSYRVRASQSLGAWLRKSVLSSISAVALFLLLYLVLSQLHA